MVNIARSRKVINPLPQRIQINNEWDESSIGSTMDEDKNILAIEGETMDNSQCQAIQMEIFFKIVVDSG